MIERILQNQNEFQKVLNQHIKTLQVQVDNLEEIQQKCIELNQKNIPLLDAVVDGEFYEMSANEDKHMKSLFQKVASFMQPYPVITIGVKTTPYQLIKSGVLSFLMIAFLFIAMIVYLKNAHFINHIQWGIWIVGCLLVWLGFILIVFNEKYYEFGDVHFYVFDSYKMKLKSIKAILNNTTHTLARKYLYKDIEYVNVITEKKLGGLGFGPVTYYNIRYQFYMRDGHCFEMNSSLYHEADQDRKSVYEILEYHDVKIVDKNNLKRAFLQNELSVYEYLEKNYE